MAIRTIPASEASKLLKAGASFVDIRGADEFRREHIAGACCRPGGADAFQAGGERDTVFYCRSGVRTAAAAGALEHALPAGRQAYIVDGGLDAWKRAGLAVVKDASQPLEMQRQVQIGAGSLVLCGVLLGALVNPGFYALSGLVGAGLIFAGVSGFCGMARVLALAPWNRPRPQQTA